MNTFIDKVAVITGAGSGLGRSLSVQLHKAGARLALCDINLDGLEETRKIIADPSDEVSLHRVDVSNQEEMACFAEEVISHHQQVDILINNAGITLTPTGFEDIPDAQFKQVLDVNMWGVYNGVRAFLPHLRARPEASIVNVSSLAGLVGLYGYTPYAMSKFAIRGLAEALQMELAQTNISVLVVHPGGIKTNLIRHAPDLAERDRDVAHKTFTQVAFLTA